MADAYAMLEDAGSTSATHSSSNEDHYHASSYSYRHGSYSSSTTTTKLASDLIRDNLEQLYEGKEIVQMKILRKISVLLCQFEVDAPILLCFQETASSSAPRAAPLALPTVYAWEGLTTAAEFKLRAGQKPIVNLSKTSCNSPLKLLGVLDFILGSSIRIFAKGGWEGVLTAIDVANEQQIDGLKQLAEEMLLDVRSGLINEESISHILKRCSLLDKADPIRRACISFYLYNPDILDAHHEANLMDESVWIDIRSVEKAMRSSPDSKWRFSKTDGVGSYREFVQTAEESVNEQEATNAASFSRWAASSGGGGRTELESQETEIACKRKWVEGHKRQMKDVESGAFQRQVAGLRSSSGSGRSSSARMLKQISNEGRRIFQDAMAVKYARK